MISNMFILVTCVKEMRMININEIILLMENTGFIDYSIHHIQGGNFTIYLNEKEYKQNIIKILNDEKSNPIYTNIDYVLKSANEISVTVAVDNSNECERATNFKKYISVADVVYKK